MEAAESQSQRREGGGEPRGAQRVVEDVRVLATDLQNAADQTGAELRSQLERRPYVTLGVAAAAGFVLAGGLASRVTSYALAAGSRAVIGVIAHELADGLASAGGRGASSRTNHEERAR